MNLYSCSNRTLAVFPACDLIVTTRTHAHTFIRQCNQSPQCRAMLKLAMITLCLEERLVWEIAGFKGLENDGLVTFLANVNSLYAIARPSVCRLSVVCNVRAPYSGGSNFRQYFYGIRYLGHPLTSTEHFTEIVPGEPLRRGVKHKRGSQV